MSSGSDHSPIKHPRRWHYWLWLAVSLAPVGVFGLSAWRRRWMSDDGFINIRVVHNLVAGYGPVFNPGERVEAHTSTLWVLMESLPAMLGWSAPHAAVVMGIGLSIIALLVAMWASSMAQKHAAHPGTNDWGVLPVGIAIYAAIPAAWDYASSGLETGLSLCWLATSFALIARPALAGRRRAHDSGASGAEPSGSEPIDAEPGDWQFYATGVVLGLGPLIRPELALFSFGFLACLLASFFRAERGGFCLRKFVYLGVAMAALPVTYQIFRMGYYAALVPNTAYAKEAFESRWSQGGHYFENFFGLYALALPLALAAVVWVGHLVGAKSVASRAARRRLPAVLVLVMPVVGGLVYCGYVVKVGGGFMHARMFLPGLFGLLLPIGVAPVQPPDGSAPHRAARLVAVAAVWAWAVYCGLNLRMPHDNVHGIGDERGWWKRISGHDHPMSTDDYRKTIFHRDGAKLRKLAEKKCPPAFGDSNKPCQGVVYVDSPKATGFGHLYPRRRTYPLRQTTIDRGIALVAQRTAMGIRGVVVGPHVHLVDHVGLASPLTSHLEVNHRGRPGHEKRLGDAWMVARFAAADDTPNTPTPNTPTPNTPTQHTPTDPRVGAARRALQCGQLAELVDAVNAPLTPTRFLANISAAFGFHTFRFPNDPVAAERTLCGTNPADTITDLVGGAGGKQHTWRCAGGQALGGIETRQSTKRRALGWLRPRCVRVKSTNDGPRLDGRPASAPTFGGHPHTKRRTHTCPDGQAVVGLAGHADLLVARLTVICAPLDAPGQSSTIADKADTHDQHDDHDHTGNNADDAFELTCPDGQIATGVTAHSGTLIDAVGLVCSTPEW